jgi:hypothetical protein
VPRSDPATPLRARRDVRVADQVRRLCECADRAERTVIQARVALAFPTLQRPGRN